MNLRDRFRAKSPSPAATTPTGENGRPVATEPAAERMPAAEINDRRHGLKARVHRRMVERLRSIAEEHSFERVSAAHKGAGKMVRAASPGGWRTNLTAEEQQAMLDIMGDKLAELRYLPRPGAVAA